MLTGAAVTWVLLLLVAPSWTPADGHGHGGRGALAAAIVHRVGAQVCHQRPERSFHLRGRPLAVCGRCTGLYASGAFGLIAGGLCRRRRGASGGGTAGFRPEADTPRAGHGRRVTLDRRAGVLALAAAPTLMTWTIEVAGLWDPGTPMRALAAVPLGAAAGWLMATALDG